MEDLIMGFIKKKFELLQQNALTPRQDSSDIQEHLATLYEYASQSNSIFETGVRGCVSSWAFLYGLLSNNNGIKKKLLCNDISICDIHELLQASKLFNIEVNYIWENNLLIDMSENYDITFIDTWHVYGQLKRELDKFSKTTNKYIIMHDTTIDGEIGESVRSGWDIYKQSIVTGIPVEEIYKGLWPAVEEFLESNNDWYLVKRFTNNNGLTIIGKK
jgi:hypothetical protein